MSFENGELRLMSLSWQRSKRSPMALTCDICWNEISIHPGLLNRKPGETGDTKAYLLVSSNGRSPLRRSMPLAIVSGLVTMP